MSDCLFCKIVAGEIPSKQVYQDELLVVFHDIAPKAPVHLLVVPRKHHDSLNAVTEQDERLMGQILLTIPKIAQLMELTEGYRTILNTGRGGGQEVFHIHFHLLGGGKPLPFA